jgi:TetR/AcrR family transcriptional regulator, transcriptional repressor for nem operon
MGRPRGFDENAVIRAAADLFAGRAYDGTSIDELVAHLGVHRNSLYKTFGSKRGLYLAALRWSLEHRTRPLARRIAAEPGPGGALAEALETGTGPTGLDLLLLAAVERAPVDPEVAALVAGALAELDGAAATAGGTEEHTDEPTAEHTAERPEGPEAPGGTAGTSALGTALVSALLGLRLRARAAAGADRAPLAGAAGLLAERLTAAPAAGRPGGG